MGIDDVFPILGVIAVIIFLVIMLFATVLSMPQQVNDSNCIYYDNQIYCLKGEE